MSDQPPADRLTMEGAKAAVIYLSAVDGRVTISKEIMALPETWHHGLKRYTYDQVVWGIREYYGKLAQPNGGVLTAAACRRILQGQKAVVEAKEDAEKRAIEAAKDRANAVPPPPHVKEKLDRLFKRVPE